MTITERIRNLRTDTGLAMMSEIRSAFYRRDFTQSSPDELGFFKDCEEIVRMGNSSLALGMTKIHEAQDAQRDEFRARTRR